MYSWGVNGLNDYMAHYFTGSFSQTRFAHCSSLQILSKTHDWYIVEPKRIHWFWLLWCNSHMPWVHLEEIRDHALFFSFFAFAGPPFPHRRLPLPTSLDICAHFLTPHLKNKVQPIVHIQHLPESKGSLSKTSRVERLAREKVKDDEHCCDYLRGPK